MTRSFGRGIQLQNGSDRNRLDFDVSSANGSSGFGLIASDATSSPTPPGPATRSAGIQGFGASGNRFVDGTFPDNTGAGSAWTTGRTATA